METSLFVFLNAQWTKYQHRNRKRLGLSLFKSTLITHIVREMECFGYELDFNLDRDCAGIFLNILGISLSAFFNRLIGLCPQV